jgi:HK97 family phage major capsid protein
MNDLFCALTHNERFNNVNGSYPDAHGSPKGDTGAPGPGSPKTPATRHGSKGPGDARHPLYRGPFQVAGPFSFWRSQKNGVPIVTELHHRNFEVEYTRANDAERVVPVTVSTTFPVERDGFKEVLLHGAENVNLARAPLPLQESHNTRAINIGLIEGLKPDGKRLRGFLRMGVSARAQELWPDIVGGIVRNLSVGYTVDEHRITGDTVTVTRWTPHEVSLVAVGADPRAGIGRSLSSTFGAANMTTENFDPAMTGRARAAEKERELQRLRTNEDLRALGREYAEYGGNEVAQRCIDSAAGLDTFKSLILERMKTQMTPFPTAEPAYVPGARGYGGEDAPMAYSQGAREILPKSKVFTNERNAFASGMFLRALYGNERAQRWCVDNGIAVRSMSGETLTQGGALVPGELSSAIIDLQNTYGAFRANADSYPMSSDSLSVPRSDADPEPTFVGQNAELTEDDPEWGQVNLTAKKAAVVVRVPTELIDDSIIGVADRVAFQLARSFAKKEDQCGFLGDGTSSYGGMQGINVLALDGSHNAMKVTAAAGHDTFAEIDASDLASVIASLPEYALDGAKWFCSGTAFGLVFSRLMQAAGGNSVATLGAAVPLSYAGFPVVISPVLPAGAATDYTGAVMLLFGNMRLSSAFGARRDIRLQVLTETYAAYDQVGIQATQRFHIVNHGLGDNTAAKAMVALIGGT